MDENRNGFSVCDSLRERHPKGDERVRTKKYNEKTIGNGAPQIGHENFPQKIPPHAGIVTQICRVSSNGNKKNEGYAGVRGRTMTDGFWEIERGIFFSGAEEEASNNQVATSVTQNPREKHHSHDPRSQAADRK